MKPEFPHASESFKRRNPEYFGRAVGGVAANRPEQTPIPALERRLQKPESGPPRVAIRVTLIALRRRPIDEHDGTAYACKPLTDAIAQTLGVDDADPGIEWRYYQLKCDGEEGVMVKIEQRDL